MAHHRVESLDRLGLLERLLDGAAHHGGRAAVDLHQAKTSLDELRIERHRLLEFLADLRAELGGGHHPALLHLGSVGSGETVVGLGAVGRRGDGLLEERDRGIGVAAIHGGAALFDQRGLGGERRGGERRDPRQRQKPVPYDAEHGRPHEGAPAAGASGGGPPADPCRRQ
jgi:hypothetical protein